MRQAVKMLSSLEAIISLLYFSLPIIYHYKLPVERKGASPKCNCAAFHLVGVSKSGGGNGKHPHHGVLRAIGIPFTGARKCAQVVGEQLVCLLSAMWVSCHLLFS